MTFKVQVKCIICRKLTEPPINSEKETNAEALNLLHYKFCAAMKLEFSPNREWDFAEEPFPYCESCGQRLRRLAELIDQLKSIEDEISGSLATLSALVMTSNQGDTNTSDPLVTPKLGQMKEYFRGHRLQEKHHYFRGIIIQRFDPRVIVERCDASYSYPGLTDELVPHNNVLIIKTEPAMEGIPGAADEESLQNEAEYKVDTSKIDTSRVEVDPETNIGMEEFSKSWTEAPAFSLPLNTVRNPATTPVTTTKDSGGSTDFIKFAVTFDEASQAYEMSGFKFKELENGSYECCTCGRVFATSKVHRSRSKQNLIKHIKAVHLGIPQIKSKPNKRFDVTFDEASKTYELGGFKFKELENGSYECCTCGLVPAVPKGNRSKIENIKGHVKHVHLGIPRSDRRRGSCVCDECGELCTTMRRLYRHRITFHGSHKFQCGHCGAKFPFKEKLKDHELTHNKQRERPYSCEQCDKSFVTKSHLKIHSVVHTSERPEQCSRCSAKFKSRNVLQVHIRMVHGKNGA